MQYKHASVMNMDHKAQGPALSSSKTASPESALPNTGSPGIDMPDIAPRENDSGKAAPPQSASLPGASQRPRDMERWTRVAGWDRVSRFLARVAEAGLYTCLVSGGVLLFQYHPMGDSFASVEAITSRIPYGFFFRRLHFVSGEAFVIISLFHVAEHIARGAASRFPLRLWTRLVLAAVVGLVLLFTGFVLKADREGYFAGMIMRELTMAIPGIGAFLAGLLTGRGETFFLLPYVWHCFGYPVLLLWLARGHVRWRAPGPAVAAACVGLLGGWSLFVPMAPDAAPGSLVAPGETMHGPWFFLGLQELLKHFDPVLAGVGAPAAFVTFVVLLPLFRGAAARPARWMAGACVAGYAGLSLWMAAHG